MSFEKRVLELAESVGISDAYFAYGSMFIPFTSVSLPSMHEIKKFMRGYAENFNGRVQVSIGDEEFAVDFVLA